MLSPAALLSILQAAADSVATAQRSGFHWLGIGVGGWSIIIGIVGIIVTLVALKFGPSRKKLDEVHGQIVPPRQPDPPKFHALVNHREFYGDDIDERHQFPFCAERQQVNEKAGQPELETTRPLEALLNWIDGGGRMMVIHGVGGLGKSRLLYEAAKKTGKLHFVQTRADIDMKELAPRVQVETRPNDILVFEDCQDYAGDFEQLLSAAQRAQARIIASVRYYSYIENALTRIKALPEKLPLGLMANVAQVVPTDDAELLEKIARISEGNPALAVMAWQHLQRTGTLKDIEDRPGLLKSVFAELVAKGQAIGCSDAREFLAELAVRNGLFEDEKPAPEHKPLLTELKGMGHISLYGPAERKLYRITPDQLRDYIIADVYARNRILQDEFARMLTRLPDEDAVNVIRMLGLQFRDDEQDVWKQACGKVVDMFGKWTHGPQIGFGQDITRTKHELVIDVGYEAWEQFGDIELVRNHLGDFCLGAEKLSSPEHLNKAGLFCQSTDQPDLALKCYQRGLEVTPSEYKQARGAFLGNIGSIYQIKGDLDKALANFEEVLRVSRDMGWQDSVANAFGSIGLVYQDKGEDDQALTYYEDALKIHREIGDQQGAAADLGNLGSIYLAKGDPDRALKHLEDALKIAQEIGHQRGAAVNLGNLGNVYQLKGDLDKAFKYYEDALKIHYEIGFQQGAANQLGNIGLIHRRKGDLDKALGSYLSALAIFMRIGVSHGPGIVLGNLRGLYDQMGRDRFLAGCKQNGLSDEDAQALVETFETADKPPPAK